MYVEIHYIAAHNAHRTEWILPFRDTLLKKKKELKWLSKLQQKNEKVIGVNDYYMQIPPSK